MYNRIIVIIGIIALVAEVGYLEYHWLNQVDEMVWNYNPNK